MTRPPRPAGPCRVKEPPRRYEPRCRRPPRRGSSTVAVVQDHTVGGDHDLRRLAQLAIGIRTSSTCHGQLSACRDVDQDPADSTAVRHRPVKPPRARLWSQCRKELSNGSDGRSRLLDFPVTAMDAGHVPQAPIASAQENAARQGGFHGHQQVDHRLTLLIGRPVSDFFFRFSRRHLTSSTVTTPLIHFSQRVGVSTRRAPDSSIPWHIPTVVFCPAST